MLIRHREMFKSVVDDEYPPAMSARTGSLRGGGRKFKVLCKITAWRDEIGLPLRRLSPSQRGRSTGAAQPAVGSPS
jgi:hypothetical protein